MNYETFDYDKPRQLSSISKLSCYDKLHSSRVHSLEVSKWIEAIVILPFGLLFNRLYCFISVFLSAFYAYSYPELLKNRFGIESNNGIFTSRIPILYAIWNITIVFALLAIT